ncbi:hypothetical protein [Rhodopirellula halodulae]|uniref:hypothetical protein n=1 Tax=Rhodopirellula halodulae TaxID=2894198 RepID=UPI001E290B19|nr:hypothetical protein [Rhodopirellula sp. JC737]MCC9655278.1 hypothetical protein [Rhodopirellula sp. JC737]
MPVRGGQPLDGNIQASTWNKVESFFDGEGTSYKGVDALPLDSRCSVLNIKNSSGVNLLRGQILSWSSVVYNHSYDSTEYWRRPTLQGKLPAFPQDAEKIAVLQEPIKNGEIGLAAVGGITPAVVDIKKVGDAYAYLGDSANNLISSTSGDAKILQAEGGLGPQFCLVSLGTSQHFWQVSVIGGGSAALLGMSGEPTGIFVTVLDPLAMFTDLKSGSRAFVKQVGSEFYYIQAPCITGV